MPVSLKDIEYAGKKARFDVPIDGYRLVSYVQGSYMDYLGHVKAFGRGRDTDDELKHAKWQADFCREVLDTPVKVTEGGLTIDGEPYNYGAWLDLKTVSIWDLLKKLQGELDAYYAKASNGAVERDELSAIIWHKELVEGSIGQFPVNLQKDGDVTIGF